MGSGAVGSLRGGIGREAGPAGDGQNLGAQNRGWPVDLAEVGEADLFRRREQLAVRFAVARFLWKVQHGSGPAPGCLHDSSEPANRDPVLTGAVEAAAP